MSKFKVGDIVIHTEACPTVRSWGPKKIHTVNDNHYKYTYINELFTDGNDYEDKLELYSITVNKVLIKEMMGVRDE